MSTDADAIAGPLIAALESAWTEIRRRHPEVPAAVLITGSGSDTRRRTLALGHFAAGRWQTAAHQRDAIDEIFIGGEGLKRGAGPVLATLLHEAAHALARVRAIQDTSRQGRYHNKRFKALAEELGLHIERHPSIGWSTTTLPDATAERYAPTIAVLERTITIFRRHEHRSEPQDPSRPSAPACVCVCGRRIRVAPSVLALGAITCGACGEPFTPEATSDSDEQAPDALTRTRQTAIRSPSGSRTLDSRPSAAAASTAKPLSERCATLDQ